MKKREIGGNGESGMILITSFINGRNECEAFDASGKLTFVPYHTPAIILGFRRTRCKKS